MQTRGYDLTNNDSNNAAPLDLRSLQYATTKKLTDHLNCPICQLPFIQPYSTICGHTFCKTCLMESMKSVMGARCPLDRVKLRIGHAQYNENHNDNENEEIELNRNESGVEIGTEEEEEDDDDDEEEVDEEEIISLDVFPAPIILSNLTDDLSVYCLNKDRGCDWIGPRWSVKVHVVRECEYTRVKCICGELTERRMLHGYRNSEDEYKESPDDNIKVFECPHVQKECEKCGILVKVVDLENHLVNECDNNLRKCDGCQLEFPLKKFETHIKHCELVHVKCPGERFGCTWKGQRDLLEEVHLKECMFVKLSGYLEGVEYQMSDIKDENTGLKMQMSTILDSILQGKVTNLGYSFELEEIRGENSLREMKSDEYVDFGKLKLNMQRVKLILRELEVNKRITETMVNENLQLRDELSSQKMMINSLRQQIQFILMERRRMNHLRSSSSHTSLTNEDLLDSKLTTKL